MTDELEICPDCRTGQLSEKIYSEEIRYRGDRVLLVDGLKCWACDHCKVEIIRADQVREGDKLIAEAKRREISLRTQSGGSPALHEDI